MALNNRLPFRRIRSEMVRAAQSGQWGQVGDLLDRNFAEFQQILGHERVVVAKDYTDDATTSSALTIQIPAETTVALDVTVVARRTEGTAGTDEDGAHYKRFATVKNVAGTATLIGSVTSTHTAEDQAGWNATIAVSSDTAIVQVTGALNNDVTWYVVARIIQVSL